MRSGPALLLNLMLATAALAAPPRVTFDRIIPAAHDLGEAEHVALISVIGDTPAVEALAEHLVEQTNRSGTLRMYDARERRHPFVLETLKKLERADAFLVVRAFTCSSSEKRGTGSAHDADGKRVPRTEMWIEAECGARVEVLTAAGTRTSFAIKGVGASAHVVEITDDEREDAFLHAARFAAIDAAEKITPRRVRESIPLDETAPAFEEGFALIEGGRFAEARAIWEQVMRRQPKSAGLHFNLAAVCEALGDRKAAELHYVSAGTLAPHEKRYSTELKSFQRRNAGIRR